MNKDELPSLKPPFGDWLTTWLESFLPFKLPRIPFPRAAKNLDAAAARIITAAGTNIVARLNKSTEKIRAQAEAEKAITKSAIDHLVDFNDLSDDFSQRAIAYTFREALGYQRNREKILELAAAKIERDPPKEDATSDIDDDWLNAFTRFAQEKSVEDIQQIWARILASEIRNPGACSIRTLDFLSKISSADANKIVKIFPYVVSRAWIPRFAMPYEKNLLSYADLHFTHEIGVVAGSIGIVGETNVTLHSINNGSFVNAIKYFDKIGILKGKDSTQKINIQIAPLSAIGKELFAISDAITPDYNFFEGFLTSLSSHSSLGQISIASIRSIEGDFASFSDETVLFARSS